MGQMGNIPSKKYIFHYQGQQATYLISVSIDKNNLTCSCSCSNRQPCKHIHHLILGRTIKVLEDEVNAVREMATLVSQHPQGNTYIEAAIRYFQNDDSCRRCNSKNIVDTKAKTFSAKLYKLISKHRYYCKDCHWSW